MTPCPFLRRKRLMTTERIYFNDAVFLVFFDSLAAYCHLGIDPRASSSAIFVWDFKKMKDNGGRRVIIDRRRCTDFDHFPERRTLRFRRSDLDRRHKRAENSRNGLERRVVFG